MTTSSFVDQAVAGPIGDAVQGYWKSRQQQAAPKLLAPILSSRQVIQEAQALAAQGNYDSALETLRKASLNCYAFTLDDDASFEAKASLAQLNSKVADPCTYRLVVKNVFSLYDGTDPLRVSAYDTLNEVVEAFGATDSALLAARAGNGDAAAISKAFAQLLGANEKVEAAIKAGLGV